MNGWVSAENRGRNPGLGTPYAATPAPRSRPRPPRHAPPRLRVSSSPNPGSANQDPAPPTPCPPPPQLRPLAPGSTQRRRRRQPLGPRARIASHPGRRRDRGSFPPVGVRWRRRRRRRRRRLGRGAEGPTDARAGGREPWSAAPGPGGAGRGGECPAGASAAARGDRSAARSRLGSGACPRGRDSRVGRPRLLTPGEAAGRAVGPADQAGRRGPAFRRRQSSAAGRQPPTTARPRSPTPQPDPGPTAAARGGALLPERLPGPFACPFAGVFRPSGAPGWPCRPPLAAREHTAAPHPGSVLGPGLLRDGARTPPHGSRAPPDPTLALPGTPLVASSDRCPLRQETSSSWDPPSPLGFCAALFPLTQPRSLPFQTHLLPGAFPAPTGWARCRRRRAYVGHRRCCSCRVPCGSSEPQPPAGPGGAGAGGSALSGAPVDQLRGPGACAQ